MEYKYLINLLYLWLHIANQIQKFQSFFISFSFPKTDIIHNLFNYKFVNFTIFWGKILVVRKRFQVSSFARLNNQSFLIIVGGACDCEDAPIILHVNNSFTKG